MNIGKFLKKIVGDFDNDNDNVYSGNGSEIRNNKYNPGYNSQGQNYTEENDYLASNIDDIDFNNQENNNYNNVSDEIFKNTKLDIKIELYEDTTYVYIKALLFGVNEEDVFIDISRDTVVISGKRESKHIVEDEAYFNQEIEWGEFFREIKLPKEINIDSSTAELNLGILFIKMKKTDKYRKVKLTPNN